jgi:hypothetical protein
MVRQTVWAVAIALPFHTPIASACSCTRIEEFQTEMPNIPLIFRGKVVKIEILPVEESPTWYDFPNSMRTTFNVKEVVKSNAQNGQQVYSQNLPYSCGVDFPRMVGRTVTIAAYEMNGKAFTGLCLFIHVNPNREEPSRRRRPTAVRD